MKKKYTKSTQCVTYLDFIQSVERKVHKKYTSLYLAKILEKREFDVKIIRLSANVPPTAHFNTN